MATLINAVDSHRKHWRAGTAGKERKTRLEFVQQAVIAALAFRENNDVVSLFQFTFGKQGPFGVHVKAVARNHALHAGQRPTKMRVFNLVFSHHDAFVMEKDSEHHEGVPHARMVRNNHRRHLQARRLYRVTDKGHLRAVPNKQIDAHGVDDNHHKEPHKTFDKNIFLFIVHDI